MEKRLEELEKEELIGVARQVITENVRLMAENARLTTENAELKSSNYSVAVKCLK